MKACRYCENDSIGYIKDQYDGDFGVCGTCASAASRSRRSEDPTVYLWNGDTWRKEPETGTATTAERRGERR